MSEVLWYDDQRIDRASQKMLRTLRGGEWVYGSELRKAADLGENTQVFYRMERYLEPSGLVVEAARIDDEARQFRLTEEGAVWVEEHAEEILAPATREEVAELAHEGYKAGTSAKESVQNYRKKVNRVKNRLDETREAVGEIADQQESDDRTLDILWDRAEDNRDRSKENRTRLETVEEDVETRATIEAVDELRDSLSGAERRLASIEAKQAGSIRQQAEAERTRAQLRRLAKPAGYLVVGAVVAYLVVLGAAVVAAPELVVGVVIAGIGAVLGVAGGLGVVIYAHGGNAAETYQTIRGVPASETAD
jgi:hypothetical protein